MPSESRAAWHAATAQMQAKLDAANEKARELEAPKMFPLHPHDGGGSIPWEVAEKAYRAYVKQYGNCQSMERIAQRGGFGLKEMDMFHPEWQKEIANIHRQAAALATAERERELLRGEVRRCWELADRELGPPSDFCVYCDAQREDRSPEVRALVDAAGPFGATG